ncbi:MAG: hypothetical protein HQ551_13565 [Desulfobacteraceae bacterium]|nr:hypothetical protein [Desulfobacteraceae bacterium]
MKSEISRNRKLRNWAGNHPLKIRTKQQKSQYPLFRYSHGRLRTPKNSSITNQTTFHEDAEGEFDRVIEYYEDSRPGLGLEFAQKPRYAEQIESAVFVP